MTVFGSYARYYDLLYRDKDYVAEVDFIASLLQKHAPHGKDILELGCGTGAHASLLAARGFTLHGVDMSDEMLLAAFDRSLNLPPELRDRLSFSQGNARNCRIGREFDSVLSLFHVVSYQTTNEQLHAMFETAALHLKAGGVFIFDYWYGPTVLTERPSVRVKRIESKEIGVTRIAEPIILVTESCVDVNYHVYIEDLVTHEVDQLHETHRMRYLFATEIKMLARTAGLEVMESCEWLSGRQPGLNTWGVCSVLRK